MAAFRIFSSEMSGTVLLKIVSIDINLRAESLYQADKIVRSNLV